MYMYNENEKCGGMKINGLGLLQGTYQLPYESKPETFSFHLS